MMMMTMKRTSALLLLSFLSFEIQAFSLTGLQQQSRLPLCTNALNGDARVLEHALTFYRSGRRFGNTEMYSTATTKSEDDAVEENDEDDDDDDEWEYEEFENLTEADFYGSEWKVGTVWANKSDKIEETWVRLLADDMQAIWGDGAKGKWSIDLASQFLSISKDNFGGWRGKKIWAGVVDDYYYLQGTIRGWNPIKPASVMGQWQAKRLGVDKGEAGVAPWFQEEDSDKDDADEQVEESTSSDVLAESTTE
mmetsp:Transcript_5631/g.8099  ORF Transcript_5631/g.8099 Transcript_5631/m.8099 type:complete len:251 (-) Transcript_5631:145-897(-)